ncbi:sensor histidine kinase [Paenibacillus campinasensis]|uniref:Sensor histidine kinase n=1 Tax=Paenibacillus campinasensis TaxID=66347 RepID=A0A268EYG4_9BACL|nr:sensor histidine kinase [Paenibacillus campinasensis]PAD78168.1 sensor histidine kinase [Paenibacillus campinasensis]
MNRIASMVEDFRYWFGRRSMQSRLVATYIVILLIPSIIVSNYFFTQIQDTYISDALNQNSFLLEMEKINMLSQIEAMEVAALLAVSDSAIKEYLKTDDELEPAGLIDLARGPIKDIERIQTNNPNILHLRLHTNNPFVMEIWPVIFQERRIIQEQWYADAKKLDGREMWVFNHRDPDLLRRNATDVFEERPKVSLIREMDIGAYSGILQVDMLMMHFAPKMFAGIYDEGSQMAIVDREGRLFMDRNQSFMANNEALQQEVLSQLAMLKEQAEENEERKDIVHTRFVVEGEPYLLITTSLERLQADVLNVVSLEGALDQVSGAQKQIITAFVILIGVLSVITYFMNTFILKNLRRLTETMKRVRRGEVESRIDIRGGGEIGELAHHFNKLIHTIHELIAQGVRKQAVTKEAELRTLHSQIDSHFLYNTLENIKMLAEIEGQRTISDALTSLGGMMRYNFKWSGEYVKLKDEIQHIRNYIDVMNIRFDEPVRLELCIPSEFMELEMLKMSLQPIVENAVKHAWPGIEDGERKIKIEVVAWQEDEITIYVTDNGIGIEPYRLGRLNENIRMSEFHELPQAGYARSDQRTEGIGLRNVHQRIQLFYGKEYGLDVSSEEGQYTMVTITFPKVLISRGGIIDEKSDDRG